VHASPSPPAEAAAGGGNLLDEDFAGELRSLHAQSRRRSTWLPRIGAAFGNGVIAGLVPSAIVLLIYFLEHRDAPLPWVTIASILAVYGPGVGVSLAVFVEAFVLAADRIARLGYGTWLIANPIVASTTAGVFAGVAPGAIGVAVFGSYHGPFVGTGLIAFGMIAGAVMVAIPVAIRARAARGAPANLAVIGVSALIATAILCAVAAVIAPVIVGGAFAEARNSVEQHGWIVGAVAGAMGGGVVGVFIGIVIALGRSLAPASGNRKRVPEVARGAA
jgi:hypothetical protein